MLRENALEKARLEAERKMKGEFDEKEGSSSESESSSLDEPVVYASKKEEFEAMKERMRLGKKPKKRPKTQEREQVKPIPTKNSSPIVKTREESSLVNLH